MTLIRPFRALRPAAGRAEDVVAPPYDVLNSDEARARAEGRPWSFLRISKPEIDLTEGIDPHDAAVYAKGAENLRRMVDEGVLVRDARPCYYVYRLTMGDHAQTGLVAIAAVRDYDSNRIRKHEFTRPDKEDDRVRQIDELNAQTGPVFLTYRHDAAVDGLILKATQQKPEYDLTADDGIQHTLWVIHDEQIVGQLTERFDAMSCLYIADGHHRSAAASRVAALRRAANADHSGDEAYDYFLSVVFPDDQIRILDYNRLIRDTNGLSTEQLLQRIQERFEVDAEAAAVRPRQAGEFGLFIADQWYRLKIHRDRVPSSDPVGRLDISLLSSHLIEPVLGISDPRRDERIDFVGGIRGLGELEKRVRSGEMALAFSLYPTSLADLMAVADAGEVMPPKSTWFEPKLADGLVSHVLD